MLEITWNHHITNEQLELYETNVSLLFAFGISSIMLCFIHVSSYSVWWFQPTWKILDNQKSKWIISQIGGEHFQHIGNHRPYFHGFLGIPLSTFTTELAPQLLGWKIDNPSGNFAALVANAQSFIAQEPPPSHRMNHKFPDWKFEGLKNLRPRFPPDISGGSYSRSKFATEIRCSSSRRLNIHTFYILICIEICIIVYIGLSSTNSASAKSWNVEASWSFGTANTPTAWSTQLFWDVFQLSHRQGME